MENINLSTLDDRHIVIIFVNNPYAFPCLSSANHLPSASTTTSISHQHRSITILGLGYILLFHHRHQSPSATPLITTLSLADLYFINPRIRVQKRCQQGHLLALLKSDCHPQHYTKRCSCIYDHSTYKG